MSFSRWQFEFWSHLMYDIFVGSESQRIGIFGKTEGTEMGLKMMVKDKTARENLGKSGAAGEAGKWGGGASIEVQKPLKAMAVNEQ